MASLVLYAGSRSTGNRDPTTPSEVISSTRAHSRWTWPRWTVG